MGTMLDQAELRGIDKGRAEQRKLDEAELKKQARQLKAKDDTITAQAARIAELEAQLSKK